MEQVQPPLPTAEVLKRIHLGFVQIFLNASIACIIYTRRLIKRQSGCFLSRNVSQLQFPGSLQCLEKFSEVHERFCSTEWDPCPGSIESQEFKVLQRGAHRCADDILDLLSFGIMDALYKDYLSILKLSVSGRPSEKSSPAIVETYTFVFQTTAGFAPSVKIVETGQDFSVDHLQKSFKRGVNSLLRSIRDLPALPRHGRALGASLLFRQSCPILYQPHGFTASTDGQKTLWHNRSDILRASQFNIGSIIINICVERHDTQTDTDYLFSTHLNGLQHSSSRDSGLLPTMEQFQPKPKENHSVAGRNRRSIHPNTHLPTAHLTKTWESVVSVEEGHNVVEEFIAEERCKVSDAKVAVQFSSQSTNHILSSEIDSESFR